jgi:cytochrome c-type biogenesis protein CcmH
MNRWLPALAAGALLALVAVLVVLAVSPRAPGTPTERAEALAAELRCPDCQGLSVADSPTSSAREIRRQIDALIAGGATDDEVRAHFVARYGEWIRLAPSAPLVWIVPFAVLTAGTVALIVWLRGSRGVTATVAPPLSDAERRRLRDDVEALDA